MAVSVSPKVKEWLPQILSVVLGVALPLLVPSVKAGIADAVGTSEAWAPVILAVSSFLLAVLPSPLSKAGK
jgi:hypothetical protein